MKDRNEEEASVFTLAVMDSYKISIKVIVIVIVIRNYNIIYIILNI